MDPRLIDEGLNAIRTRGFAGQRDGDIRLISLRHLRRSQLERVCVAVENIARSIDVRAEVCGIGFGCTTIVVKVTKSGDDERSREQVERLFKVFGRVATELLDCEIQIVIQNATGERLDLRHQMASREIDAMELLTVAQAISAAVAVVKNAPGALETARRIRLNLEEAQKPTTLGLAGTVSEDSPAATLVQGLSKEVQRLSEEFVRDSMTWSEPDRQERQRRVAAKAARLLADAKPLLASKMADYPVLVEFFSGVANRAAHDA